MKPSPITPDVHGGPCENTDREIWREREGDYYADSIHVTEGGGIGINCGATDAAAPRRPSRRNGTTLGDVTASTLTAGRTSIFACSATKPSSATC